MNKNAQLQGNLQAFPVPASEDHGRVEGITKREYFAAMAMQGMLSNSTTFQGYRSPNELANEAVLQADALLNELHPQGIATDFDEE
jgi:hypothetical protein